MNVNKLFGMVLAAGLLLAAGPGVTAGIQSREKNGDRLFQMASNRLIACVVIRDGMLFSERLEPVLPMASDQPAAVTPVKTDADFQIQLVWTGWQAPGKLNNAENPVCFTKKDFRFLRGEQGKGVGEIEELNLFFCGIGHSLELRISYRLGPADFYLRRKLAIKDPESRQHFLQRVWPCYGVAAGTFEVLNRGGFGQPLAFQNDSLGLFMGMEYPASENILLAQSANEIRFGCGQEIGEMIIGDWIEADPVVMAITPRNRVKSEFMRYVDDIRVSPLKPYVLYNTWYDLRAPEMVKKPENVLNEENVMRIISSFETKMAGPFGIKLDAFVLDDGWDIYRSDWLLRPDQFPGGLMPIADRLKLSGIDLGIWFGPTGGYSNRGLRLEWMKSKGYETVGDQLCLAGERYRHLLKTRIVDFIRSQGIGYFKWDGIQFTCSQPDHGHAVGIYSRRAVMESLKALCQSARRLKPDVFLNVTSGTWLSPWWVKYANTIWMQGHDYGYANVPSISQRDRAMTYRDYVLYEGLRKNNFWFPLANLMTHGIIKGHLQKLGGESEPLDKFSDNALLYVARGVSMWELYISPDLLTEPEWEAIGRALHWAKDRFPVLMSTEMVGGNPGEKAIYGYLHVSGNRAVIVVRNPYIEAGVIGIRLDESAGFTPRTSQLVLERIYPSGWVSPDPVGYRDEVKIFLQGYETAIYELFPLSDSKIPLLAGAVFQVGKIEKNWMEIEILEAGERIRLLNPEKIKRMTCEGKPVNPEKLDFAPELPPPVLLDERVERVENEQGCQINLMLDIDPSVQSSRLAILLENPPGDNQSDLPSGHLVLDGQDRMAEVQTQEKSWKWILLEMPSGRHHVGVYLSSSVSASRFWPAKLSVWFLADQKIHPTILGIDVFEPVSFASMPGSPRPPGILGRVIKLKEFTLR